MVLARIRNVGTAIQNRFAPNDSEKDLRGIALNIPHVSLHEHSGSVRTDPYIAAMHKGEIIPKMEYVHPSGRSGKRKPSSGANKTVGLKEIPYSELGHQKSGRVVPFGDILSALDNCEHDSIPVGHIDAALKHPVISGKNGISPVRMKQLLDLYEQKAKKKWTMPIKPRR